jgi:Holliday junction resolvasome RuvABC endonuclease subunit
MRVLALDPSSTACGWAILDGSATVHDLGVIRPGEHRPFWSRVTRICDGVGELLDRHLCDEVLIEVTTGLTYRKVRASSLAALGMAQGAVWRTVQMHAREPRVVNEREWTAGRTKRDRARSLGLWCDAYRAVQGSDKGGDIADAIEIGLWWLDQRRAERLAGRA